VDCVDSIFFQAELTPEKLAIVAHGSVLSYGRLAQGIVSAQQRLTAAGVVKGQTIGLHIAHPIDHFVLFCALYRMKTASAPIYAAPDAYLDNLTFDAVLLDSINPAVAQKQPHAKLILVDPAFFQDKVTFSVALRTSSRRDIDPWVCRITASADTRSPTIVKTTSPALEAQLISYCLSAAQDWERMISVSGLHTNTGVLLGLSALFLGRTVCFADAEFARNLIVAYKHHYLVGSAQEMEPLLRLQETDFVAMPSLRAVYVEGRSSASSFAARCQAIFSANTVCGYAHPEIGIVAYGPSGRIKDREGAAGFVGPWIDIEVLGYDNKPVVPGQKGALRIRARDQVGSQDVDAGWIYPGQQVEVTKDNLLVIHGAIPARDRTGTVVQ
jgi:acyl-coenzyme A synthetase/AMP-(fatty) acid ligase